MKDYITRGETEKVLRILDEIIQKHQIKSSYTNYLLALRAVQTSKQRAEADRLYDFIRKDSSIMSEVKIQARLTRMHAVAIGDIAYSEQLVPMIHHEILHISVLAAHMAVIFAIKIINENHNYVRIFRRIMYVAVWLIKQ